MACTNLNKRLNIKMNRYLMGTDFCLINFFDIIVLNVMIASFDNKSKTIVIIDTYLKENENANDFMIEYRHHKNYLSDPKSYVKKCGY